MKKLISLLMALVLVFSLVACSTNNTETKVETEEETNIESDSETNSESGAETEAETKEENKEVEVTALVLKDNTVLVSGEGLEQQIVKLEAGNQETLVQGHKYSYSQENPEIKDPLVVEKIEMAEKLVGTQIETKLINELLEKVEGVKIVDTRPEADFAQDNIEGSINLPADNLKELIEKSRSEEGLEALKGINKEDVVLVLGADADSNNLVASELLYKVGRVNVTLNGGAYADYKAQ